MAKLKFKDIDNNWVELGGIQDITYQALYSLYDQALFEPNATYRITDYESVHIIPNTGYMGGELYHPGVEPLLVTAIDNASLSPIAYSPSYPQDIIYYSIDNDQNKVQGCEYGYISRRIDTIQYNDIPFDFRNVVFRRWKINVTNVWDVNSIYNVGDVVVDNGNTIYICLRYTYDNANATYINQNLFDLAFWHPFIWPNYTYASSEREGLYAASITVPVDPNDYQDFQLWSEPQFYSSAFSNSIAQSNDELNILESQNNVIFGHGFSNNKILSGFSLNSIDQYFRQNIIHNGCERNYIGPYCEHNILHNNFSANYCGRSFSGNIVEYSCYRNVFTDNVTENTIGPEMNSCFLGDGFSLNTIHYNFNDNNVGINFTQNIVGYQFNSNHIGDNFQNNVIGSGFEGNTVKDDCQYNRIGNRCVNNMINNQCKNNEISDEMGQNNIEDQLQSNKIGTYFQHNNIGTYMAFNSIGDFINNSTSGYDFYNNIVDSYASFHTGEQCTYNHFKFGSHITVGDYFTRNTVEKDVNTNIIDWYYVYNGNGNNEIGKNRVLFMNDNDQVQLQYTDKYSNTVILNDTEAKINPIPVT